MDTNLDQATRLIEIERAQIGHEIHDALLPLIFAASAAVNTIVEDSSVASSTETQEKLQQTAAWLDDAMQTGRRLLTQVYPPELANSPWTKLADDALGRLFDQTAVEIQWLVDPATSELPAPIALTAYRIVVEATRNAIRHGKATEVVIIGEMRADGVHIVIRDNGCGFDPSKLPADRFGIRSMIGRAELVGGALAIDSVPGGPTVVAFTTHSDHSS